MNDRIGCRIALALAAALIIPSIAAAQTRAQRGRPAPARPAFLREAQSYEETTYVTRVTLKNGLTVLVNEFRAQPVVSMQAWVRTGRRDDPAGLPGAAKLLAAMVERGPSERASGSFRQNVHFLGGFFRTEVDDQTSCFELVAPARQWKKAFSLQSAALLNPAIQRDELKLESELAMSEALGGFGDPARSARESLLTLAFSNSVEGIQRKVPDDFGKISRESLLAFHKATYTPDRILLVVSGDVNAGEVLNEAARAYGAVPAGTGKRTPVLRDHSQKGFRYAAVRGRAPAPQVLFGFHTVAESEPDFAPLEVLRAALGLGEGAALSVRLRDEKRLILSAEARQVTSLDFGYLIVSLEATPGSVDKSEIAALTEIELMKRAPIGDADLGRAVAQLELSYWKELEGVSGRARALGHFELIGDWKRMQRRLAELRQVKAADVMRVAAKYLTLENCSLLEHLPSSFEERTLTTEGMRNTLEGLLGPSTDQEQESRDRKTVLALTIPKPGSFTFSEVGTRFQVASILRGPDLFIKEDHTAPVVDTGIFFRGGKLSEKKENAGVTMLMLRVMGRGASDKETGRFIRQLELYGGRLRPVVADDFFGFHLSILSQNVESGLALLLEAIRNPVFDEDAVSRHKELQRAELAREKVSAAHPEQALHQALFGDFPYSMSGNGTEAGLAALAPADLEAWRESYVRNTKPVVAVIGDTIGTSLAASFVRGFSGSRMKDGEIPAEFAPAREKGISLQQQWDGLQDVILVGFQAPPEEDDDAFAVSALSGHIGGMGVMSQELRDRLGLVHGIAAHYHPRQRGGTLVIRADVRGGGEAAALKAVSEEIGRLRSAALSSRDFRSALNTAVGRYEIGSQKHFEQIHSLVRWILAGRTLDQFQAVTSRLEEVREEEFREAIRRVLDPEKGVFLTLQGRN